MRSLRHGWQCALVTLALSLVIACDNAPAAPTSASADEPTLRRQSDDARGPRIPFAKLNLFFEFNSTDNDLGLQLLLDGEPWEVVNGFDPRGQKFVELLARGRMEELGLTELFFESAEPSPQEVLALFPAGTYRFSGETVEGERLAGTARLSHNLPPAPVILSPSNGEQVDRNNTVIRWQAISGIASYQVIVANEDLGVQMAVDIKPPTTRVTVPSEFLRSATEYSVEVLAIGDNGNKTITQQAFVTKP